MNRVNRWRHCRVGAVLFLGLFCAVSIALATPHKEAVKQQLFATPNDALQSLKTAVKSKDQAALDSIFGPERQKLLSGDPVEDNNALEHFAGELDKSAVLEKVDDSKYTLTVGDNHWPVPIPIVKDGSQWRFDTKAGEEEILNRHIGRNELSTIATCRAYVLAQWEYFTQALGTAQDGLAVYSQKFISTPGKRDGLYWDTPPGKKESPLGKLVAEARAEGYNAGRKKPDETADAKPKRSPYHGYYYKILTKQGPHAPGGKFNYIINGNMIAGYALIAYPDKWGSSGIKTFIVNQQGRVYEKDLGPTTDQVASGITEYDPDPSWKRVREQ